MKYKQKQECKILSKSEIISANYIAFLRKKKYIILKFILSILDLICMNANKISVKKDGIEIYNDKQRGLNPNEISIYKKNILDIYLDVDRMKKLKTLLNISDTKIDNEKITVLNNLGFITQEFKYGLIYIFGNENENVYKDINTIIKHDLSSCKNYNEYNLTPSTISSKFKLKLAKIIKNMFLKTDFCKNIIQ
jgi:hypothetical protein